MTEASQAALRLEIQDGVCVLTFAAPGNPPHTLGRAILGEFERAAGPLAGSFPKTEIGLPEVKIGLIPGWGGTQRLTRLLGPALAAELICAGEAVNPQRARELGIVFDAVPSARLMEEGLRLLEWARQSG